MQIKEITYGIQTDGVMSGYKSTIVNVPSATDTFTVKTTDEIIDEIIDLGNKRVVLCGGSDAMLQKDAPDLIAETLDLGSVYYVLAETLGTVDLKVLVKKITAILEDDERLNNLFFSLEYQCPSTGKSSTMLESNLSYLGVGDALIFRVASTEDLNFVADILEENVIKADIFVIPNGISLDTVTNFVATKDLQQVRVQKELA